MKIRLLFILCLLAAASPAVTESAPSAYLVPSSGPAAKQAVDTLPPQAVQTCLASDLPRFRYTRFEGANDSLAKTSLIGGALQIGEGYPIHQDAHEVFGDGYRDGEYVCFAMSISSVDAVALRVQADLGGLSTEDEVWVIDPMAESSYGPFQRGGPDDSLRWLPTIWGDTAVVLLRTTQSDYLPPLVLERISHFFRNPATKQGVCPIPIACEGDAAIQTASSAVGMLILTGLGGATFQCTGSLINNADTPENEPYFITANHCFKVGVSGSDVEVIWDYRASACSGGADPSLGSLPRSFGATFLASSRVIDMFFMRLSSVPVGDFGRSWLGWNSGAPAVGRGTLGIHHPMGSSMKISYGQVTRTGVNSLSGTNQTEVRWNEGITEQGSSGSPLLFSTDITFFGVLSNGNRHECGFPEQNIDNYSSFRDFFSTISCWLSGTNPCPDPRQTLFGRPAICASKAVFAPDSLMLESLRKFRDRFLAGSPLGETLIGAYYASSPRAVPWLARSAEARALFTMFSLPFASWGMQTGGVEH